VLLIAAATGTVVLDLLALEPTGPLGTLPAAPFRAGLAR
jgi:hypothetical protein